MALNSISALAEAIDAVKKEAGDFAEHKPLIDALAGLSKHIGGGGDSQPADQADPFQEAEKRHREITAANAKAQAQALAKVGEEGGESKPDSEGAEGGK